MAGKRVKAPGIMSSLSKGMSAIFGGAGSSAGKSMGSALMGGPKPRVKTRSGATGGPKRVKARKY